MGYEIGVPCPIQRLGVPWETDPCKADLQGVTFEGRFSVAAGVAAHLQTVHGIGLQTSWRLANQVTVGR